MRFQFFCKCINFWFSQNPLQIHLTSNDTTKKVLVNTNGKKWHNIINNKAHRTRVPSGVLGKSSTSSTAHPKSSVPKDQQCMDRWAEQHLHFIHTTFSTRRFLLCIKQQEHENVGVLQQPELYMSQQQIVLAPVLPLQSLWSGNKCDL